MSSTAPTTSTGLYVLACSSPSSFYDVVPDATAGTASGQNVLVSGGGTEIVAACASPAWIPYIAPFDFTQADFLVLAPALMGVMVAVAGAKYLINFMRGRR